MQRQNTDEPPSPVVSKTRLYNRFNQRQLASRNVPHPAPPVLLHGGREYRLHDFKDGWPMPTAIYREMSV